MEDQKPVENEAVEKPIVSTVKNKPNVKNIGVLILIGLCISLFVIGLIFILFFRKETTKIFEKTETGTPLQDAVIATANYIESQRNADGTYAYQAHADTLCPKVNGELNCPFRPDNISLPANSWSALGNYSTYKITLEEMFKERALRDLKQLVSYCADTTKDCTYLLAQPAIINKEFKNPEITKFLKSQSVQLAKAKPSSNLMLIGIEARELALLSESLDDSSLLDTAKKRLTVAEEQLQKDSYDFKSKKYVFPQFACWVTLAQAELGRVTKNDKMMINAAEYLKQNNRLDEINNYQNPVMIQPCIETLSIAKLADIGYLGEANKLMSTFKANFYDISSAKIAFGEFGTTYYPKRMIVSGSPKSVYLADSAYTNYLNFLMTE